jgi:hypothetical protein
MARLDTMWISLICTLLIAAFTSAEGGSFTYPAAGGNYVWNTAQVQRIAWTSKDYGLYSITLGQQYKYVSYVNPVKVIFSMRRAQFHFTFFRSEANTPYSERQPCSRLIYMGLDSRFLRS